MNGLKKTIRKELAECCFTSTGPFLIMINKPGFSRMMVKNQGSTDCINASLLLPVIFISVPSTSPSPFMSSSR